MALFDVPQAQPKPAEYQKPEEFGRKGRYTLDSGGLSGGGGDTATESRPVHVEHVPLDKIAGTLPQAGMDADTTHRRLIESLDDEVERQAEERYQMAIDEDYNDHRHWRQEDAQVLIERGQMPLVFNQGRQSIEWLSGTEKRARKDYKVLPREPGDEASAEVKTHLLKYTDDANKTQWHRSFAFKRAAVSGLWYLEEGVNANPEEEIIYSGNEDWKNVIRDSRGRDLLQRDHRYLFRKKRLDLDYATHLLQNAAGSRVHLLRQQAQSRDIEDGSDPHGRWYLGERLTNASEVDSPVGRVTSHAERNAYMQSSGYFDTGRRLSVDIIECYYRVSEAVKVFLGGPFDGKIFNELDPRHQQLMRTPGTALRDAVRMRMRIMICTADHWLWDGPSPFSHGQFPLIPVIAYQRARDGQIYGMWRGMRDLSDDTNKRRAKALWAVSANRVIVNKNDIADFEQDLDKIREEAARPDGVLVEEVNGSIRPLANSAEVQGNLMLAEQNTNAIREMGGVTAENLGLTTAAQSGKAILAKQDQGSLTTSDLFDNYALSIQRAGQQRLSNIEQFWTHAKAIRIIGKGKPFDWVKINEFDPETGEFKNDVTQRQADFEVDTQDYRASMRQAGLESMFALLGQIATYAPQVVMSVLDLVVEGADLPNKGEWVARIRKLNGQRDPSRAPTPEELQADAQAQQDQAKQQALQDMLIEAEVEVKRSTANKNNTGAQKQVVEMAIAKLQGMLAGLDIGIVATNAPQVTKAADAATAAAGLELEESDQPLPGSPMVDPTMPPEAMPALPGPEMAPPGAAPAGTIPGVAVPE